MSVLIHIMGPTGSGKTTLGKLIKKKYPYILIKEIDEIFHDLPSIYHKEYKQINNKFKFYEKFLEKGIKKFINEHSDSIIILTGFAGINNENKEPQYINLNAEYKFFIDIPEIDILKQRFNRYIDDLNTRRDYYFNRTLNEKPLLIDFNVWRKKINANNIDYYKKNNYKFMNNKDIYKKVLEILIKKFK